MASVKIIGKVAVKVMPDTTDFKRTLEKRLDRIERQIGDLKVDVVPNVNKAAERRVKMQMERLQRQLSGKNVQLQPRLGNPAPVSAALAALTRDRKVSIEPDLDQKALAGVVGGLMALGGARVALDSLGEGIDRLMEFDRLVPMIAATGIKLGTLASTAIAATGHLFSLGASLLSIGGAGFALPGLLGGIGIGLGVTIAAFKDFDAVIPELGDKLSALQDQLSAQFWAEAEAPIRHMIDVLWPGFAAGILQTSEALGTFFGNLATSFAEIAPSLQPMFNKLVSSIEIFSTHTDSIAGIIETLGVVGAAYLPQLATWFGEILDQFDAWLSAAAADGRLKEWIDTGITNLQALGEVIWNVSTIFKGIADAAQAAGGITLVGLAGGLQGISDIVNSDGFQSGLTKTFAAANDAMTNLTNTAGPGVTAMLLNLRDTFIAVAPGIGTALGALVGSIGAALADPNLSSGIVTMFEGIKQAMYALSGAAAPLAAMLGAVAPIVGALAENIAMLLTTGLDRMAPTFVGIAEAILPLIDLLGATLQDVMNSLTPLWQTLGDNVIKVLDALGPLIKAFQDLWNLLAPVLVPVLQLIAQIIGDSVVMAINGVTNVVQGFVGFIKGFVNLIKALITGDWKAAWNAAKEIISSIFEAILGVIQIAFSIGVLGLLKKGWAAIKSLFTEAGSGLKSIADEIWDSIKSRASTMWDQIQVMPGIAIQAVIKFLKGAVGDMKAGAQLVWDAIKEALESTVKVLMGIITGLPAQIKSGLGALGSLLTDAGRSLIQGLIDGITSMIGSVKSKLGELTNMLPDWKGPAPVDKVLLKPAGQMIIEGLITGLESRYKDVRSSLQGLTNDIASSMDTGSDYRLGVSAQLDTSGVNLSAIGGLTATVGAAVAAAPAADSASIQIDNITIPLEDLRQLKSLEDFLDMLRVRTRQGVIA